MNRRLLAAGAVLGLLGVAFGAFGAHALAERLDPSRLKTFELAARYQLLHAVAIAVVAVATGASQSRSLVRSGWCFVAGVAIFSGSLYLLALTGVGWLGAITPIGGISLLCGWGLLFWSAVRDVSSERP